MIRLRLGAACSLLATLPPSSLALGCGGDEPPDGARVLVAGPSYTGQCEDYSTCDGAELAWITSDGIEVHLSSANLKVLFGMATDPSEPPTWADEVVPGHDAVDDFATDGGIVELPAQSGFCTVALGPRLCDPCHLRTESCDGCSISPGYIGAWLDREFVEWSVDVDVDVGPFACEVVPDERRWFILEIQPREWFEGVTTDMIDAHERGDALAEGDPLYDVVIERITDPRTFATRSF